MSRTRVGHLPSRRQVLQAGTLTLAGCSSSPPVTRCQAPAAAQQAVACTDERFAALVNELVETPRRAIFDRVAENLRKGFDLPTVLAANFHAGVRVLTPSVNAGQHSVLAAHSVNLLVGAVSPEWRLAAVLWSVDNMKAEQQGRHAPLKPVEENAIPDDAPAARTLLLAGLDDFDPDTADRGATGMFRHAREELQDILLGYSTRDQQEVGHRAIFATQAMRSLDAFGWGCGETVVRALARGVAEAGGSPETLVPYPTSVAWTRRGVDLGGTSRDRTRVFELLAASRELGPEAFRDATVDALAGGLSPDAVWDCLLAAGAEIILRGNGGVGLHCFDAMNALRIGSTRVTRPEIRALMLLQAAAWVPLYRRQGKNWVDPIFHSIDIDKLEPGTAPDDVDGLFDVGGQGRGTVYDPAPARAAMAWFAEGGDVCAYTTRGRQLVIAKSGPDAHHYKYPVAAFEEAARVGDREDAFWQHRFLAAELLVNPSTKRRDWDRLAAVKQLSAELQP